MEQTTRQTLIDIQLFEPVGGLLRESVNDPTKPFIVKGVLQRADAKNQNGRVYPISVLRREAENYSNTAIKERRALGELDHADTTCVNLKNVSHNIIGLEWEGNDLIGILEVLTTPSGNILRELFRANIRVGISSRGIGSVKKDIHENADVVQDDYTILCWDVVSTPSTMGAFLFPTNALNEGVIHTPSNTSNKWNKVDSVIHELLNNIDY